MRIDMPAVRPFVSSQQEIFEFTRNGYSSRTVEVLNFKRDLKQNKNQVYRFDTVAIFNGKSLIKNPSLKYTFYDQTGQQVRNRFPLEFISINFS
jgi:putative alpha-1,2-mannosidase